MKKIFLIILMSILTLSCSISALAATRNPGAMTVPASGPNAYIYKKMSVSSAVVKDVTGKSSIKAWMNTDNLRWAKVEYTESGKKYEGYMLVDNLYYTFDTLCHHYFSSHALVAGDTGRAVKNLKICLKKIGYDVSISDGKFGAKAEAAVRAFQKKYGLMENGIVGQDTKKKLLKAAGLDP